METNVNLELKHVGVSNYQINKYADKVKDIHEKLKKNADSKDKFLGWLNLPRNYDKKEFEKVKKIAKKVRSKSQVLVVVGIGGSYLGSKAVIQALSGLKKRSEVEVIYVGNNLNSDYINEVVDYVSNKDISLNVISKSGTTIEPAISFRIFRSLLENKYGVDEARKRIFVTTTKGKGALYNLAIKEKYVKLTIPENIGGRYSVLTSVGLLPMAVAGIDIDEIMKGAEYAMEKYDDENLKYNDCYKYAVVRNILYKQKKDIELLAIYNPKLSSFIEWWKQLFGESEGKKHSGIFPSGVMYTTDLHSMGQYVQEGRRNLFETVLNVKKNNSDIVIDYDEDNIDELNYVAGKKVSFVEKSAMEATINAHVEEDVPNIVLKMEKINEQTIGHLIYFFEKACAMSGMLQGVNPFDQPGVEKYKKKMYELLGKYE